MTYYVQDIDEKILAAIGQIFQMELIDGPSQVADPLALRRLTQSDLQDDPTTSAPFVAYRDADGNIGKSICLISHGQEAKEYGEAEIGGPIRYLYYYCCDFGTPLAATREKARADGATLMNRIIATLIRWADLANILAPGGLMSDDGTKLIEGQNNRLVTSAGYSIFGGESTFYGKGMVHWRYPVSWNIPVIN